MKKVRILLAGEDGGVVDILVPPLEERGYKIVRVFSPEDALAVLKREGFGAAIVDLSGNDGLWVLKGVDGKNMGTPIVVVTDQLSKGLVFRSLEKGAYDCLPNTIQTDELLGVVERALNTGGERRSQTVWREPWRSRGFQGRESRCAGRWNQL